jgi:hypothetical protein
LGPPNRRLAVASLEGAAQQAVEADERRSSHGGSSRWARRGELRSPLFRAPCYDGAPRSALAA